MVALECQNTVEDAHENSALDTCRQAAIQRCGL
jgi:hypothetical protein